MAVQAKIGRYPFVQKRSLLMKELTGCVWFVGNVSQCFPWRWIFPYIYLIGRCLSRRLLLPTNYRAQGTWPSDQPPCLCLSALRPRNISQCSDPEGNSSLPFPAYRMSLTCWDEITRVALIYMQVTHYSTHAAKSGRWVHLIIGIGNKERLAPL